jgi:hypothetical protein
MTLLERPIIVFFDISIDLRPLHLTAQLTSFTARASGRGGVLKWSCRLAVAVAVVVGVTCRRWDEHVGRGRGLWPLGSSHDSHVLLVCFCRLPRLPL